MGFTPSASGLSRPGRVGTHLLAFFLALLVTLGRALRQVARARRAGLAAASLVLLLTGGSPSAEADGSPPATWSQVSTSTSPPARENGVMAYDVATDQLLLFGGDDSSGTLLNDTWVWTGTAWNQLSPATSPLARNGAVMAYDAATSQLVLFGGSGHLNPFLNDTWIWTGTTWSQLNPPSSPPGRTGAAMGYDAATSQLILYGGYNGLPSSALSDTWLWTGSTWSQLSPPSNPGPLSGAAMGYDAATGQLVQFGGMPTSYTFSSETSIWDGTTWAGSSTLTFPSPRSGAAMGYDATTGQLVLFGGIDALYQFRNDTWDWTGTTWSQLTPSSSPPDRARATLAYDARTGQLVLFGGLGGEIVCSPFCNDTWIYQPTQAPAITSGGSATFTAGVAGTFTVTTSGFPAASLTEQGALPQGVSFVDNHDGTATLGGTPQAGTAGTYGITITASNGVSPNATQAFTLTVSQITPITRHIYLPFVPNICTACR